MKPLHLIIKGLPHCPRNRSHTIIRGRNGASFLGKTEAARRYEEAIMIELEEMKELAAQFAAQFDKSRHALTAHWVFYSPDLLTKDGKISENSTDLDAHKVLQDTVMEFVGIDDAYIIEDKRQKWLGDYKVLLTLEIVGVSR